MTKKFVMTEMPRNIVTVDPDMGFGVSKNNKELAAAVLRNGTLLETTQLGNQLYKHGNRFIMVDPHRVTVLYYMKWKEEYYNLLGTTVVKEMIQWRDRGVFESRNLTSHVFFDLLLPIHGAVMTDHRHTADGQRFWLRTIDEAFDRNLNVYMVNFFESTGGVKNHIELLSDKLALHNLLIRSPDAPWGDSKNYEARRIVISNKVIGNEH
jgi:hypothetical protein